LPYEDKHANFAKSETTFSIMAQASPPALKQVTALSDLGTQIRAARQRQGLRIDDAASLCGVSVDLLSRLENGKGGVATNKVLSVLHGLGLTLVVAPKEHPGLLALMHEEQQRG
jgi:ribosome-binding protein aMBF1 (putative translation factor)